MSKATEMVLYRTCKRMIERGSTDGLAEKIDIFYAAGKLTDEHYAELTGMLRLERMLNECDSLDREIIDCLLREYLPQADKNGNG